ncbi:hypothetical protein L798_12948 [Zootermopsis nevadensis]|uniref:Uncharacterized protein n=1 Tax=Zootermopsis nevadensis TaxID=136037 RepID=A0A067R2S0_ZOONE|nr:hypothetical protein L798_12948 [Zootermopsis nevadensis]
MTVRGLELVMELHIETRQITSSVVGLGNFMLLTEIWLMIGRLRWLGHVQRKTGGRYPKKALNGQPGGRRRMGRPRMRWLDDVGEDLRTIGVRRWRRKAESRDDWKTLIREAKVLTGP